MMLVLLLLLAVAAVALYALMVRTVAATEPDAPREDPQAGHPYRKSAPAKPGPSHLCRLEEIPWDRALGEDVVSSQNGITATFKYLYRCQDCGKKQIVTGGGFI